MKIDQAYRWDKYDWDWSAEQDDQTWSMTELTSSHALELEGMRMRHCVGGYAHRCIGGYSAIFSLSQNGNAKVTVEINPVNKVPTQAKGFVNREPNQGEHEIIALWLEAIST